MNYRKINFDKGKGVYVILDLRTFQNDHLQKLEDVLTEQVLAVQLWDNLTDYTMYEGLINVIVSLLKKHQIPILINNRMDLLERHHFDGVHFDEVPANWSTISSQLTNKIIGITCTNDREILEWAQQQPVDYVSFCSMFPSANNSRCELVDTRIIAEFQEKSDIPFFLSGGVTAENIAELNALSYQGIALVSGLMHHEKPKEMLHNMILKMN